MNGNEPLTRVFKWNYGHSPSDLVYVCLPLLPTSNRCGFCQTSKFRTFFLGDVWLVVGGFREQKKFFFQFLTISISYICKFVVFVPQWIVFLFIFLITYPTSHTASRIRYCLWVCTAFFASTVVPFYKNEPNLSRRPKLDFPHDWRGKMPAKMWKFVQFDVYILHIGCSKDWCWS